MASPFFSIIIPTLNEEIYLPKLLSALNEQLYIDFEVIVVDADSKDQTEKIVKEFKVKFPLTFARIFEHNVSAQRNYGAQLAKGKYIFFIDADVVFSARYLKQLYSLLKVAPVDFATTALQFDRKQWADLLWYFIANRWKQFMLQYNLPLFSGQNLLFRKEVFDALSGFDERIVHAEDLELSIRAAKHDFKAQFFMNPYAITSIRRIIGEGRLTVSAKQWYGQFHTLIRGPIRKHIFPYKMGGAYHQAQILMETQKKLHAKS